MTTQGITRARPSVIIPLVGCLSVLVAAWGDAQTTDVERALFYASTWQHGVRSIPDSIRQRVAADRDITDVMEAALLGRIPASPGFDKRFAVWWLSESGRPEYLPILLRFSADSDGTTASFAIYGLARHAGNEAVRARLLEVDASGPTDVRNNLATLLAGVNDVNARALLVRLNRQRLTPMTIRRVDDALRAPPRSAEGFRAPCLRSEVAARKPQCTQ